MYENYVLKILINTALLYVLDRPEHYELNVEKVSYVFTWKISESSAMFAASSASWCNMFAFFFLYVYIQIATFMIKEK